MDQQALDTITQLERELSAARAALSDCLSRSKESSQRTAMRDMSKAIRHELQDLAPSLQQIGEDDLRDVTEIVGAFFYDLVGEQDRRGWGSARPAATVARTIKELRERVAELEAK